MTTFPVSPTDGDLTADGRYTWRATPPPGRWEINATTLDDDLVALSAADNSGVLVQIGEVPPSTGEVEIYIDERVGSARTSGTVTGAVGTIELDMSLADDWLIASTAGNYTIIPTGFRRAGVDVLYVTTYTTTLGNAMTFGLPHRYVGLLPSESTWAADERRTFRYTYLPNLAEWVAEELSAQFDLNVAAIELLDAAGPVPDTSTPPPAAPFTAAVYRFDSGVFTSGGVVADETAVGSGAASADEVVHLAVVDAGDAYATEVDRVRWFVDPQDVAGLSTWATTTPTVGENGFAHASTAAPWSWTFNSTLDPTGQGDPSWDVDGPHDIYAQVLFDNTFVSVVKVDLTVNNGLTTPAAPGVPTSFTVTADLNAIDLAWVAPVSGETGAATITTGTDPTALVSSWQSATIGIPQTTVAGDVVLLVVQVANSATTPAVTVPAGYTQIGSTQGTEASDDWQAVYYHVAAGATSDAAVSVTSANIGGYAIVLEDVDPATVLDATTIEGSGSTPAGVTTVTDGAMVVQCVMTDGVNNLSLGTANGFTLEAGGAAFDTTQGNDWSAGCASKLQATAGAVTAPVWAQGTGGGTYVAWHTIVFRPAATGGTTTATGYDVRHGATNPPTGAWVDVGNVLAYTVSGLTGGVVRYAQVRPYDTIGQRGTATAVGSATPTGATPDPDIDKTVDGWSVDSLGTDQNWSVFATILDNTGVYMPRVANRANASKTASGALASFFTNQIDVAFNNYNLVKNSAKGFIGTDPGPRLNGTFQLSWTGTTARPPNHTSTLLDLARCARGDYNSAYAAAANVVKNSTVGGYDWVERTVLSPAHEANGQWYASYFGVQDELIGVASLVNASDAEWGADVAAALRSAGADGDRGPVWVLAWKQMAETFRAVDPRFWIGLNLAQEEANPDGLPSGSANWNDAAIAGIAGYFDSIDVDAYGRDAGIPSYNGTGDISDPDNWTSVKLDSVLAEAEAIASTYGVPVGFGEAAAQFELPGVNVVGRSFCTDQEAAIWYKKLFAWYDARPSHLAFLWQQPDSNAKPTGTTYIPKSGVHPLTWAVFVDYFGV